MIELPEGTRERIHELQELSDKAEDGETGPAKSCAVDLPKRLLRSWPGALIRREATAGSWRSAPLVAVPFAKRLYRRGRAAWLWS